MGRFVLGLLENMIANSSDKVKTEFEIWQKTKPQLDDNEFQKKLKEPFWLLETGIIYIHGYDSAGSNITDIQIVKIDTGMAKIFEHALDACNANDIELISAKNDIGLDSIKVRPIPFIEWVKTIKLLPEQVEEVISYLSLHIEEEIVSTGLSGRPTKSKHLLEQEFERRKRLDLVADSLAEEVCILLNWLKTKHPNAPLPKEGTTKNNFREKYRHYKTTLN